MILTYLYYTLIISTLLSVVIPFIKNDFWIFRVFDYPRFQKFIILLFCTVVFFPILKNPSPTDYLLFILMVMALSYLAYLIIPYTPLGKKMVQETGLHDNEKPLNILVCNVYQENQSHQKLIDLINSRKPNIIFLLETDMLWKNGIMAATETYPYKIEVPLNNTYGLLFYSDLPILFEEVNYLISKEIPSIIVDIAYNKRKVRLYGLHPTPPVPQENTESTERDAEILMIGKMAKAYPHPCIVFGDLNDVAWSRTTRLFLKSSSLLDARRGRGMYNTFHTKYWIFRWPLDHFFISAHFRLIDMRIEKTINSDHFPMSISLVLREKDESEILETDQEIEEEVHEKIKDGIEQGNAN